MAAALRRHDPRKLRPIELHFFSSGELRHKEGATDSGERQSVGLGQVINVIGGDHAAGARHILHNEIGIAGNLLAEEARIKSHPDVMIVAGLKADNHANSFPLEKICLRKQRFETQEIDNREHSDQGQEKSTESTSV